MVGGLRLDWMCSDSTGFGLVSAGIGPSRGEGMGSGTVGVDCWCVLGS